MDARLLRSTLAMLFLTGCAHAFDPDPPQSQRVAEEDTSGYFKGMKPPLGGSRIYVYRNKVIHSNAAAAGLVPYTLLLDGQPLGDLEMDHYVDLVVKPGDHVLTGRFIGESNLPLALPEGTIVYVRLNGTSLEVADSVTAGREISEDCQPGYRRDLLGPRPSQPRSSTTPETTM